MKIGGFMKQSFVDFPGNISAVIFTVGCNMNCWYCHNRQLIDGSTKTFYSLENILVFLESRKTFLDGVVISGGEPTLQPDLLDVIMEIKKRGFKVKLDTNGSNPEVLEKVLPEIDFVAMDVKTSLENYPKLVGAIDSAKIKESIDIIKNSGKGYEFRITLATGISEDDLEKIGKLMQGVDRFAIQTYRPQHETQPKQDPAFYEKALKIIKKYVFNAFIR